MPSRHAPSAHPLEKERNRKLRAGATVKWVEYERKVKGGNWQRKEALE
jgi:hypothetical protein